MTIQYLHENVSTAQFGDILVYVNNITGEFFGLGILLATFFIMFFAQKKYPAEKALASSLFLCSIIAPMLTMIGILSVYMMWMVWIIFGFSIIYLIWENSEEN